MEDLMNEMRPGEGSERNGGSGEPFVTFHGLRNSDRPVGYIYDIGGNHIHDILRHNLRNAFTGNNPQGQRSIPSELFFAGEGVSKWCQITRLPEFYQTRNEIDLLKHWAPDIARQIAPGSTVIDMGCGDTRKILPLLLHLEEARINVTYYALDLSLASLQVNMDALTRSSTRKFYFVRCFGLWGTFRNGFDLIKSIESPIMILSLGSMFGNDQFDSAVSRLIPWAQVMKANDRMLLGLDSECNEKEVWTSYHDSQGTWDDFIRSGLRASNEFLGHKWFSDESWEVYGNLKINPTVHNFTIRALNNVMIPELGLDFSVGDTIDFFESWKYKPEEIRKQFAAAGLQELKCWKSPGKAFCKSFKISLVFVPMAVLLLCPHTDMYSVKQISTCYHQLQ